MKRGLRWLKRIVLGLLALAVLAIVVVVIVLHTDWGRDFARRKVEAALVNSFPGGAKIGRIEGSIFGTLTVHDLELDGLDGKPFVKVAHANIRIALAPLVRSIARIETLEIDGVEIDQHPQPARPPEAPGVPKQPTPWSVELPHIALTHARITIATASGVVAITDVAADASLSFDGGAITAIASVDGTWRGRKVAASTVVRYLDGIAAAPFVVATVERAHVVGMGLSIGTQIDGVVRAELPATLLAELAMRPIPGDVVLVASAHEGAVDARVDIAGASVRALVRADLAARSAQGLVIADVPDGARLDKRFAGAGIVTASVDASRDHVRGIVTLDGVRPVDPTLFGPAAVRGKTLLAIDAVGAPTLDKLASGWVFLESGLDLGGAHATGIAELTRTKDTIMLVKSTLIATAKNIGHRKTDLSIAAVSANARATGEVWPKQDLHVTGMLGGDQLRFAKTALSTIDVRFDATNKATVHVDLGNVRQGPRLLGSASLDAHGTWTADRAITIDVDSHSITTASNGVWAGSGGRVVIDLPSIVVTGFRTNNGKGSVVANVKFANDTKNLEASVEAKNVALATLAPKLAGTAGAKIKLARTAGRWSGGGTITGRGVKTTVDNVPPFDIDAKVALAGRHVTLEAATTSEAGNVTLVADVDGPYDPTDAAAWKRLDRRAIRNVSVEVAHVDGTKLGATGTLDGNVAISAKGASGKLEVHGIETSSGPIAGDVTFAPRDADIVATMTAKLEGVDTVDGIVDLALPEHLFDPAAWAKHGKNALRSATIHAQPVDVDPALLAKFHVTTVYQGRVEATAIIAEGLRQITATVDVTKVNGGALKLPVDVHVEGELDKDGAHLAVTAKSAAATLLVIDGRAPIDLDRIREARAAPLTGSIEIPLIAAKDAAAVFGRNEVTAGTVAGKVDLGGTIGVPTVDAKITADGVTIPASISGRPPAKLDKLIASLHWNGSSGELDLNGSEGGGGMIHLTARGRPDQPATLAASFESAHFDIAPFTAFLPGALVGAKGVIDASLVLKGFDPNTGDLRGMLQIHGGRMPLSPLLGTLRKAEIDVSISGHKITAKVDAKLGKETSTISGNASVTLVGSTPNKAELSLTLKQISLVRALQPTIDASIVGNFNRGPSQWTGDIVISKGHVLVASSGGAKLLDASAPDDMVFVDKITAPAATGILARPPPTRPWMIAEITIKPTTIDIIQDELEVRGGASGKLTLSLGQGSIGLDGEIDAQRGDIDLLGSRSQLDHGTLLFDGTVDPLLDLRIIRELPDLTITADVTGRLSHLDPPRLSADRGSYTQGELYAAFIGGQPSGDRSEVGQAAIAAGAGVASSYASRVLNQQLVNRVFPNVKLKFNYEAETASSSQSVRVGTWYSRRIFIAYRSHLGAQKIDENNNEGILELHLSHDSLIQANAGDQGIVGADYVRRYHW